LGTPLICGNVPWQSWYVNLGGNPTPGKSTFKPKWTTVYFLGVNDLCNAFRGAWPVFAGAAGYKLIDPPAYDDGLSNYSSMISTFKSNSCDFFTNVPLPPDFNTMWKQASQQGYKPKLATVAKVLLFPSDVGALGPLVENVATDAWWTANMPWTSSLTGETCKQIADEFTAATGEPWVQSLSNYSLFEVAYAALSAVDDPHDKAAVADAMFKVKINALAGQLDWTNSKNPAPGVQWKKDSTSKYGFSMFVVDNTLMPNVPTTGALEPTNK